VAGPAKEAQVSVGDSLSSAVEIDHVAIRLAARVGFGGGVRCVHWRGRVDHRERGRTNCRTAV
jgi:hypothetical protein